MMRYIKLYEESKKYDVGDYIRTEYYFSSISYNVICNEFKIIDKKPKANDGKKSQKEYKIVDIYGKIFWINNVDIKRKLNKKEIQKFELEKTTNQYNI